MIRYVIPVCIVVFSNVLYHVCQRSIARNVNPMVSLIATYIVALVLTIILLPFFNAGYSSLFVEIKKLNWASYVLGLGIIGLEAGYLLAYRAGWMISMTALYSTTIVALLLIPIGLLFFREKLMTINVVGILLAIAGVIMMSIKPGTAS